MIKGVDVSGYQGPPDDWKAAAAGIDWAAVKITELEPGGIRYVNPDAKADLEFLAAQGKARIGYMFGHPSVSPVASAEFFAETFRSLGMVHTDGVALDIEVTDGLPPAEVDKWALDVLAELEWRLSRHPLVYTFENFARAGNTASLGHYPLWIADPSDPAGKPQVPPPWAGWVIQQTGITGAVDRDVAAYNSIGEMQAALGRKDAVTVLDGYLITAGGAGGAGGMAGRAVTSADGGRTWR